MPIIGLRRLGIYNRVSAISSYEITDHLGNVRAVIQKVSGQPIIQSFADYYPFGELLPNRKSLNYRYAFQGQELDGETGMEAFQLRLWDGRLGRWLSPDPYGQYASPYLGMGNNPIGMIDPDGGFADCPDCPNGKFSNGTEWVGSDGYTYSYDDSIGGWSDLANVSLVSHKNTNKAHNLAISSTLMMRANLTWGAAASADGPSPIGDISGGAAWLMTAALATAIVAPTVLQDDYTTTSSPDDSMPYITLYRGVHAKHDDFMNALRGEAHPWALGPIGHMNPGKHNSEDIDNYESIYTSWAVSLQIARMHSLKSHPFLGVVLMKRFRINQTVPSPDIFDEGEVLVPGIVTGAKIIK